MLQGQGVAKAAITQAAQGIQLRADAPGAGGLCVDGFGHAVAMGGGDGQGERLAGDLHVVVAEGNDARQHCVAIKPQFQGFAVFKADPARGVRFKVARQVQPFAAVDGHQGWQVFVLLHLLQFVQAGVDLGIAVGRVAQAFENGAQGVGFHSLRATVCVDPIDGQARSAGEDFQVRFAQGCSPTGDKVTRALYGGKCVPALAGVSNRTGAVAG
ncbi:hypothetical protein [Pseudomonas sp. 24 R 17]|nr:hypothetical protein [Pseudomonas sp. 24 R 17]